LTISEPKEAAIVIHYRPWKATLDLAALVIGLVFISLGYRFSNKPQLTLLHWLGFGGLLFLLAARMDGHRFSLACC